MIEGIFFKQSLFPQETIDALMRHPNIGRFESEQAIYITDVTDDLEVLLKFIFNTHDLLTGQTFDYF